MHIRYLLEVILNGLAFPDPPTPLGNEDRLIFYMQQLPSWKGFVFRTSYFAARESFSRFTKSLHSTPTFCVLQCACATKLMV